MSGALLGKQPRHLGEPDVPAHEHPDPTDRRLEHRVTLVAGSEPKLFLIPEVRLR